MDAISEAKRVFNTEINALAMTKDCINTTFERILGKVVSCKGKVIITGMGKSGHVARKIAATLSSLGTSSFYLNPAEAMHGDLGMIRSKDIVIMISYSGESDEIVRIIPSIKLIGAQIIAITGNENSALAKYADVTQILPKFEEACNLGLAPTSSTTAVLCYGDALAIVASEKYGFRDIDFGKFHPSGALGKKILYKVDDIMATEENNAIVYVDDNLSEAIIQLTQKKLGLVTVVDNLKNLVGVITTGDLGRQLEKGVDIYSLKVEDIMTSSPITIETGSLAVEALNIMKKHGIYSLPVISGKKVAGTINMQKILDAGLVAEL